MSEGPEISDGRIPSEDELKKWYATSLKEYRAVFYTALEFHAKSRHLPLQGAAEISRLMFARIMLLSGNISRLCPDPDKEGLWDFTSIALLARSLFESLLFFRYFIEQATQFEMLARVHLLYLFDCAERVRLFTGLKRRDEADRFSEAAKAYREYLKDNQYFQSLEISRQKELLNASRPSILTLREMSRKYTEEESCWVINQLLSHYAHSYPLSFMRNDEARRDGLANQLDLMYVPGVLNWLTTQLTDAIKSYGEMRVGIPGEFPIAMEHEQTNAGGDIDVELSSD